LYYKIGYEKQAKIKYPVRPIIIGAVIIISGIGLGLYYGSLPGHRPQRNKSACESVGGIWSNENNPCLLSYKKTGEACTDGGQCISGICFLPTITEEQKVALNHGSLKNIVGTCYADNNPTGCVPQIILGTISKSSLCLDN
jgi:hypothetical protein